ncbi:MAG: hypothetical protein CVV06_03675 [Gammaproteobacteria bacterium HGW-Gammaproteobacteria-10]|nr:MAG: hypothetical protein CVV06_03675 [Gammaproteobacteria bacterium HGW-Gammaproteobacteria-10]
MKQKNLIAALFTIVGIISTNAQASVFYEGFDGDYYNVGRWTIDRDPFESDAAIDLSNAPISIELISGNNAIDEDNPFESRIDFSIKAAASGIVSFDWSYITYDSFEEPIWDPFGYIIDGVFYSLSADDGLSTQSGSVSFDILAGQIFGFRQIATDSLFGSAHSTISNFSAPVPLPGALVLFGIALASLNVFRRNRAE